jgi:putative nucleotidyltransferase with HDIG domain
MPFDKKTFNSKIASRIFLTFVACALVPVVCLSGLFYLKFTRSLETQNEKMLGQIVKSQAKALFDRLNLAEQELDLLCSMGAPGLESSKDLSGRLRDRLRENFKNIGFFKNPGKGVPLLDRSPIDSLNLSADDVKHLADRKPLIAELNFFGSKPFIIVAHFDDAGTSIEGFLAAEMNFDFLWSANVLDNLPPDTGLCVLNSSRVPIYSTEPELFHLADFLKAETQSTTSGIFEFSISDETYVASYSQMFLKPRYKLPHWTLMIFRAKSDVLKPIENFKKTFQWIIFGTILLVVLLSIARIRKSMVPVAELIKGVDRIAIKDFSQDIHISSNDEFEVLAAAFNQMAGKLDHSFKTLSARAEIDRAVLSTLDRDTIIKEAIMRISDCVTCDTYGLCLIDSTLSLSGQVFYKSEVHRQAILSKTVTITPKVFSLLKELPAHVLLRKDDLILDCLLPETDFQMPCTLLLPIRFNSKVIAVLWIGVKTNKEFSEEDISVARQIGDQLSIALSNANLVTELSEMSWGTLQALARMVDAKSAWTAGHSLRVTELAQKVGGKLNLDPKSLEALHRASLLHDIGKVGVPSALLDKSSKLTDEEFQIIKGHPALGARIIEPIKPFKELMPIIAQHHERYDGGGYPYGYAADQIHWGARILAVADVFDALASDRPYRKAMPIGQIFELMQKESGRQFDPAAVSALLNVMNEHAPQPQEQFKLVPEKVPAHEKREKATQTAQFVNSQRNSAGACTS